MTNWYNYYLEQKYKKNKNLDLALENLIDIAQTEWKQVISNKHENWDIILLIKNKNEI